MNKFSKIIYPLILSTWFIALGLAAYFNPAFIPLVCILCSAVSLCVPVILKTSKAEVANTKSTLKNKDYDVTKNFDTTLNSTKDIYLDKEKHNVYNKTTVNNNRQSTQQNTEQEPEM